MLKIIKIIIYTVVVSVSLQFCTGNETHSQKIDLLDKLILFSGNEKEIVISDLFYSEDYSSVKVMDHSQIELHYDMEHGIITMKPNDTFSGYTSMIFQYKNQMYHVPVQVKKKIKHQFVLNGYYDSDSIFVFGNFSNWRRDQHLMSYNSDTDRYTTDIYFDPGRYEYRFYVDGKDMLDPGNPDQTPNGLGDFNSLLIVKKTFKGDMPHITPWSYREIADGSLELEFKIIKRDYVADISKPDLLLMLDNQVISEKSYVLNQNDCLRLIISESQLRKNDIQYLRLVLSNTLITSNFLEIPILNGRPLPMNNEQILWNDAIIYSLMIDRFYNANQSNDKPVVHHGLAERANFQGGDLQGILKKIEEGYFNHLGVNTLWISPWLETSSKAFQETPQPHRWFSGYHGYWPVKARSIDPRFGNDEILKSLVTSAHKNDIKILMDFISNHVHEEHPYYKEHRKWFGKLELPDGRKNLRLWDEKRLTTWFDPYIPSFDYLASEEAIDTVVADALWWLEEYNLDGFRHDAVKHVPNKFWRALTKEIRKTNPDKDVFQIGETFGDNDLIGSYVNNGQLSAQFNFNQYWPARDAFSQDSVDFKGLSDGIEKSIEVFGQLNHMANMMDSHDQPRFPAYLEKDLAWDENASEVGWNRKIRVNNPLTYKKIALYYSYLMTSPGIPVVYYGNEIGMTGAGDPDNRRPMRWGENVSDKESRLRTEISTLIGIRNRHSALRNGDFMSLYNDKTVLAYIRSDLNERLLVVVHRASKESELILKLPKELSVKRVNSLYGDITPVLYNNNLYFMASPYSAAIFSLESRD
ncbi:hypothetical protein KAJ27_15130 [bacterium]|nr:hypothetical protein [Candidatus Neomarinimicrobiota bacterium]MCK5685463.1 hypothetical protein [bacterium]